MAAQRRVVLVGGGIFGICAALELADRGDQVTLIDAASIPAERAASTDISKILRMDYGADEFYTLMMIDAFRRWEQWNQRWNREVFHPTGFLLLTKEAISTGSLEADSLRMQAKLGFVSERVTKELLVARYPAWNAERYRDGYFNVKAGWAESGLIVSLLRADAEIAGVRILENLKVTGLAFESGKVVGVHTQDGLTRRADCVVVAAGTWSPLLSEELAKVIRHTAQPVFHFLPKQPELFRTSRFPVWSADIGKTGFYGFPITDKGVVKISNHGPGREMHPDAERTTTTEDERTFREFLGESLPALADAPIAASRTCFYADSWDGDFYIDRDPRYANLVYATGGSGHGFKFAPVLGEVIADVVEGKPNRYAHRFAWREPNGKPKNEQARFLGIAAPALSVSTTGRAGDLR